MHTKEAVSTNASNFTTGLLTQALSIDFKSAPYCNPGPGSGLRITGSFAVLHIPLNISNPRPKSPEMEEETI